VGNSIGFAALVLAANPATGVDPMIIPAVVALAAVIVFGIIGIVRKKRENAGFDARDVQKKDNDDDEQDDE
jgi:LPXTG-motif cell wall-anchored protein